MGGVCRLELVKEIFPEWKPQEQNSWIALLPLQLKDVPSPGMEGSLGCERPEGRGTIANLKLSVRSRAMNSQRGGADRGPQTLPNVEPTPTPQTARRSHVNDKSTCQVK